VILITDLVKPAAIGLLGCLSTVASHRRIAIYHDGLRTVVNEVETGTKTRRELGAYAYSISMSFIVGAALPYALATGIIVIHMICLGGDVIGSRLRTSWLSGLAGFGYAAVLTVLVDLFVSALHHLPPAAPDVHLLFLPLSYTFPLLAAVAATAQFGARWGAIAVAATLGIWGAAFEILRGLGFHQYGPYASGIIALALVTLALLVVAFRSGKTEGVNTGFFEPHIRRIRHNWMFLVPIAALISVLASRHWLAGEPVQAALLNLHLSPAAAAVAFFSFLGFIPLQGMTGLVSGVWNQDGYPDWLLGVGYVISNPFAAAAAGAGLMGAELLSLRAVGRLLTSRPGVTALGNAMRDALDLLPSIAVLAGGVWAAIHAAGPAGAVVVVAAYYLNDVKGRPVTPLAVPVFAYLLVAVLGGLGMRLGVWS
jgi:hypothetical protein